MAKTPRMLDETPSQLVEHLSHPNGWWRSEAQKLIILHNDKSVVPALTNLATSGDVPLGRLHALWTLEGLAAINVSVLSRAMADSDARVRAAAIRIAEPLLESNRSFDRQLVELSKAADPNVAIQVLLSTSHGVHPQHEEIEEKILEAHAQNEAIKGIASQIRAARAAIIAERKKLEEIRRRNRVMAESIVRGKSIYNTLCITCHGQDGKGVRSPDNPDLMLAPPLAGSSRVRGHKERLTRILLNGLIGPVDRKTYAGGLMLPMGDNPDQWIADVGTYVRNTWGNRATLIEASDVARIRAATKDRVEPWTLTELGLFDPPELENRKAWKLSASHGGDKVRNAIDGNDGSRWDTGTTQKPGMWFEIELPEPTRVMSLTLDTRRSGLDYPRGFLVKVAAGKEGFGKPVAIGQGLQPVTEIELSAFDPVTKIRIEQTGSSPDKYWSIHELVIKGLPGDADLTIRSLAQNWPRKKCLHLPRTC